MVIVSYIIASTVWHGFSDLSNNYYDKLCVWWAYLNAALGWFAMAWNMWQWINTLRDFDHGAPRTLFICFVEWPWFNSEINHSSQIYFNFVCEQRLYHINVNLTSQWYIPCQNICYPVQYEHALTRNNCMTGNLFAFSGPNRKIIQHDFSEITKGRGMGTWASAHPKPFSLLKVVTF